MVKHRSKGRACQMERLPRTVDGSLWYCSSSPLLQTPDHVGIVNICSGRTSYFDAIAKLASPAHTGRRTGTPLQFKAIGLQEPPGYKGYLATYDVPQYVVTLFMGIKASLVYAETDIKYLVPSAQHSGFRPRERSQVDWRLHLFGRHRRQTKGIELVDIITRTVSDLDHFGYEIDRGNGDHAFSSRA